MISRKSSLRLAVAALALTAGLSLAGCGNIQPGVAAQVGDQKISVSFLDEQIQWYHTRAGDAGEPPSNRLVLWQLVVVRLFEDTGKRLGVTLTPAEIAPVEAQLKAENSVSPGMVGTIARGTLLETKLKEKVGGEEQFVAEIVKTSRELGVTLNPRYGTWNDDEFMRTGPNSFGSGALVTPKAQPSAQLPQLGQPVPEQ